MTFQNKEKFSSEVQNRDEFRRVDSFLVDHQRVRPDAISSDVFILSNCAKSKDN